jgi:hypothetical protein
MPKPDAPQEPPPWAKLPGGSLEWLAQGIVESLHRRAGRRRRERDEAEAASAPRPVPVPGPVPDDDVWREEGHVRTRDFFNRFDRDPVGAMLADDLGGVTVEIMPGHLTSDELYALEAFVARLLVGTR